MNHTYRLIRNDVAYWVQGVAHTVILAIPLGSQACASGQGGQDAIGCATTRLRRRLMGLSAEERNWATLAHASGGAVMLLMPSFGFVGPLLVWLTQKDKSAAVAYHAQQALYFQVAMTLAIWICGALGSALACFLVGFVFYALALLPWLAAVVLPLLAANNVNSGADDHAYPLTGGMVDKPPQIG